MPQFTVDTHLFRELGELLVGRDSTALIELIKNSYDADATKVIVIGESLADPERGLIRVVDDGNGMDRAQFENGFLRIASRGKELGTRRSPVFGRRFTGAKGIGRLAAHKLARVISLESLPRIRGQEKARTGIEATIDWDRVEQVETLDKVTEAIQVRDLEHRGRGGHGTTIFLRKLRKRWTGPELARFIGEVHSLQIPPIFTKPQVDGSGSGLFTLPLMHDVTAQKNSFELVLEGDFSTGADYWQAVADNADWLIEIDASNSEVRYLLSPFGARLKERPPVDPSRYQRPHEDPINGPFFQARIFVKEGRFKGTPAESGWARGLSGIRIFLEGFRVLPYGEIGNDWLSLDADYTKRSRKFSWMEESLEEPDADAGLSILPNKAYFGGVFLTAGGASCLRALVNREGFVPDACFDNLSKLVKIGIELSVRARAAANAAGSRAKWKGDRPAERTDRKDEEPPEENSVPLAIRAVQDLALEAKKAIARTDYKHAVSMLSQVNTNLTKLTEADGSFRSIQETAMMRILASVGTQMAAFIHEINALLGMAEFVERAIDRLRQDEKLPINARLRSELAKLQKGIADLRRSIERQASYLIDVVSPDARRRRSRQPLAERFDAACRLVQTAANSKGLSITNSIDPSLKSPAMFQAELTTVFSNLLSNAVKAAEPDGRIRASSRLRKDAIEVVVENSGIKVSLDESERWFLPFESTTLSVDPTLGQGMGLGLPITRNMLAPYGASIGFVKPSSGFATAIMIVFPL